VAVPAALLALMVGGRFLLGGEPVPDPQPLYERASRAYAEQRYAAAAEYARHALSRARDSPLRAELLCLRGESHLRAGEPAAAREAFETALREPQAGAYLPQALFGLAQAQAAAGNPAEAARTTERLLREHPQTPWAQRAGAAGRTQPEGP
jgi:TolA-binding protein